MMDNKKNNVIRDNFPFLNANKNIVYLDSAATTLKPSELIKELVNFYTNYSLNTHSEVNNVMFKDIEKTIFSTRKLIIEKIGGNNVDEVIFVPSATYAFNILSLALEGYIKQDNEIILTYLEHSSNCFPLEFLAKKVKSRIIFCPLDKDGYIDVKKLINIINNKTKLVSIIHTSNAIGVTNNIYEISLNIKMINPNCLILIDVCQSIISEKIFASNWNLDFLIFSAHKLYGPTGLGILWINSKNRENLKMIIWGGGKKISPSNDYEKKDLISYYNNWEVGSLPLAQIFGLKAILKWLKKTEIKKFREHVLKLKQYVLKKILLIEDLIVYNLSRINKEKNGIITFNILNYHPSDISEYLGRNNVLVRSGDFCCPYLEKVIGVSSAVRISLDIYNNYEDIDKLVFFLKKLKHEERGIFLPNL